MLESDQTIEAEAPMLDLNGVDFYHSRIPMESEVTPTTLSDMEQRLPAAALADRLEGLGTLFDLQPAP